MMALLRSSHNKSSLKSSCISLSRALFYSTETTIVPKEKNSKKNDNLYRRISPVGDPKISMIPILDQWEKEGKTVRFQQLIVIIKSLRKFHRYTHALQLSEWMNNKKTNLQPAGVAIHLDLLSRVKGLEEVEKYFNSMPNDVKNLRVFGALLNCYTTTKSVEKAEATAEKMKQTGMMTTLSYNSMLTLYKRIGDNEKLDKVYQEMIEMGVACDKPTYYIRLSAYAAASDIEGMEKLLRNMEESSSLDVDWNTYVIASGGYLKSGLNDKAYEMLKKSEGLIYGNSKGVAWETLLRLYASLDKKDDVYRIWDLYKTSWSKVYNRGYSAIVNALVKLDDIDGAEKLLVEWGSQNLAFDFRIPNMVIEAFCNKGDFDKAKAYVDQVIAKGKQPPASTWVRFVTAYVKKNDLEKAAEMMKKCVVAEDKRGCKLSKHTLEACVEYLKENDDLKTAKEIVKTFGHLIRYQRTSAAASLDGDEESGSEEVDEIEESRR